MTEREWETVFRRLTKKPERWVLTYPPKTPGVQGGLQGVRLNLTGLGPPHLLPVFFRKQRQPRLYRDLFFPIKVIGQKSDLADHRGPPPLADRQVARLMTVTNLTPEDDARIRQDDAGIVWLCGRGLSIKDHDTQV